MGQGPGGNVKRIIVGITGASGAIYGIRMLEALRGLPDVETHLVMSTAGQATVSFETNYTVGEVRALADHLHSNRDVGASISSGSFQTSGMIVAPCSVKTLAGVATSYDSSLITRAADVVLKERRRLVLMLRETPLHAGHLHMMQLATAAGAVIAPPVPAFYTGPETLDDVIAHTVGRVLDLFGLDVKGTARWGGMRPPRSASDD